jgi:hypothetical protein
MTADVVTVTENAPLDDVVALMEKHHVKRLPVMREDELVGIITRANLLRAIVGAVWSAKTADNESPTSTDDEAIRSRVISEIDRQPWAPGHLIDVVVRDGSVELWGTVFDARQRDAARVAAENAPGVKAVENHITWIDPMSGVILSDSDNEAGNAIRSAADSSGLMDQRRAVTG